MLTGDDAVDHVTAMVAKVADTDLRITHVS
jgi:hypothetical protein